MRPIATAAERAIRPRAWRILDGVADPEIPVVSVVDLGIARYVEESTDGRRVRVTLTPTYSGCPASEVIEHDVRTALEAEYDDVMVDVQLSPAWTTEWITDAGRQKLHEFGIAPPERSEVRPDGRRALPVIESGRPARCPQCGSAQVEELSGFGSTPCKALWRCLQCREPFDYFKSY